MTEMLTNIDQLTELVETAENSKLLSRAKNPTTCISETRSQLKSDLKTLNRLLPPSSVSLVFSFFYYLRTQSVSPSSGVKEMYEYFAKAITTQEPITIVTWDCPGCANPYVKDGEITRDPLITPEEAAETLQRRRFVTRADLALPLLTLINKLQKDLPINFTLITAGLNAQTYYPQSVSTPEQRQNAIQGVNLFTDQYRNWVRTTFGETSFPVIPDLSLYPLDPGSKYWQIYEKIVTGQIPIPEFILKRQLEINARITDPLGLTNQPEAINLATRVIAAYGAEGVILDELKPKLGNIIVAATEAISVFYQRSNFARQFLGLKPIPTFYTLYD